MTQRSAPGSLACRSCPRWAARLQQRSKRGEAMGESASRRARRKFNFGRAGPHLLAAPAPDRLRGTGRGEAGASGPRPCRMLTWRRPGSVCSSRPAPAGLRGQRNRRLRKASLAATLAAVHPRTLTSLRASGRSQVPLPSPASSSWSRKQLAPGQSACLPGGTGAPTVPAPKLANQAPTLTLRQRRVPGSICAPLGPRVVPGPLALDLGLILGAQVLPCLLQGCFRELRSEHGPWGPRGERRRQVAAQLRCSWQSGRNPRFSA